MRKGNRTDQFIRLAKAHHQWNPQTILSLQEIALVDTVLAEAGFTGCSFVAQDSVTEEPARKVERLTLTRHSPYLVVSDYERVHFEATKWVHELIFFASASRQHGVVEKVKKKIEEALERNRQNASAWEGAQRSHA